MSITKRNYRRGIRIKADDVALEGKEGEIKVGATSKEIEAYLDGASRSVVTKDQSQVLSNKTIDADVNTISNLEVDNLKAGVLDTDLTSVSASDDTIPSAKATKTYADSVATTAAAALTAHLNDTVDAHDASAISNIPAGNLAATEVQAALNELQSDIDTRALDSALTAHITDTTDAHAGSAITNVPSGNLAATTVQGALNELQTDVDTRIVGPASATDNRLVRYDGTTGKLVDVSNITADNSGNMTGVGTISAGGLISTTGNVQLAQLEELVDNNSTLTGANQTVTTTSGIVRLSNSGLTSIDLITGPTDGKNVTIVNQTGNTITINNNTGSTAAQRILTGTKANLTLKDEASILLKYDVTELRWMIIGGTGAATGSGINYVSADSDAEAGVGNYIRYANSVAAASPESGTGGSPNAAFTFTVSTSSPLRDIASYLITKDANNRQGSGVSVPFTIASADQASILTVSFDYSTSANYVDTVSGNLYDSDMRCYIYDVTNSQLIEMSQQNIAANVQGHYVGTFQTNSNSTSYRLIFHVASTNALAYTMKFDNVQVGPRLNVKGAAVSDWISYTPTGTWLTNATYAGKWRRIGDSAEYQIKVSTSGLPTAASLQISLASGHTIDSSKLNGATSADALPGSTVTLYDSSVYYSGEVQYLNTTNVRVSASNASSTYTRTDFSVTESQPFTFGSGDYVLVSFKVPILGWSSNLVLSEDTGNRLVVARAKSATTSITGSITQVVFPSVDNDTTSSYNSSTGNFTVPESGYYSVEMSLRLTAALTTTSQFVGYIFLDSAEVAVTSIWGNGQNNAYRLAVSSKFYATKGQVISGRALSSVTANLSGSGNDNVISISKLSSPQTLAGSETVAVRAVQSSGQSITNTGTGVNLVWDASKPVDTHNAFVASTGIFTAPVSAFYAISTRIRYVSAAWAATNESGMIVLKNGANVGLLNDHITEATVTKEEFLTGTDVQYLKKGETLNIQAFNTRTGGATALQTNAGVNIITINSIS